MDKFSRFVSCAHATMGKIGQEDHESVHVQAKTSVTSMENEHLTHGYHIITVIIENKL